MRLMDINGQNNFLFTYFFDIDEVFGYHYAKQPLFLKLTYLKSINQSTAIIHAIPYLRSIDYYWLSVFLHTEEMAPSCFPHSLVWLRWKYPSWRPPPKDEIRLEASPELIFSRGEEGKRVGGSMENERAHTCEYVCLCVGALQRRGQPNRRTYGQVLYVYNSFCAIKILKSFNYTLYIKSELTVILVSTD